MKFHPQGSSSPLAAWWAAVVATAGGAVKKKQDHRADEEETMTIASNTSFDSRNERDGSEDPANRGGEKKKGLLAGRFQGMPTSMRSVCTMLVTKLSINSSCSKSKTTKANKNKPTTPIIKKRRQDIAEFYV
jgi:hypothetical protein